MHIIHWITKQYIGTVDISKLGSPKISFTFSISLAGYLSIVLTEP